MTDPTERPHGSIDWKSLTRWKPVRQPRHQSQLPSWRDEFGEVESDAGCGSPRLLLRVFITSMLKVINCLVPFIREERAPEVETCEMPEASANEGKGRDLETLSEMGERSDLCRTHLPQFDGQTNATLRDNNNSSLLDTRFQYQTCDEQSLSLGDIRTVEITFPIHYAPNERVDLSRSEFLVPSTRYGAAGQRPLRTPKQKATNQVRPSSDERVPFDFAAFCADNTRRKPPKAMFDHAFTSPCPSLTLGRGTRSSSVEDTEAISFKGPAAVGLHNVVNVWSAWLKDVAGKSNGEMESTDIMDHWKAFTEDIRQESRDMLGPAVFVSETTGLDLAVEIFYRKPRIVQSARGSVPGTTNRADLAME